MKLFILTLFALICLTIANSCNEQNSVLEKAAQECSSCENKASCLRSLSNLREINQHCECNEDCKAITSKAYKNLIGCTDIKFLQKRNVEELNANQGKNKKKKNTKKKVAVPPPPPNPSISPALVPPSFKKTPSPNSSASSAATISSIFGFVAPVLVILKYFF